MEHHCSDYRYAIIDFEGVVLVPDAGDCYERACEISRAIPAGKNGHGVVNLSWEQGAPTTSAQERNPK